MASNEDPPASALPQDSAEEDFYTPSADPEHDAEDLQDAFTNRHPSTQAPLSADQWCLMNQIQQLRMTLTRMETIILKQKFTVAHHLVLMKWQESPLGPSLGHPDTQMWLQANNILRGYAHDCPSIQSQFQNQIKIQRMNKSTRM